MFWFVLGTSGVHIICPLKKWLHLLGVWFLLLLAKSLEEALKAKHLIWTYSWILGHIINLDKLILTPSHNTTYLGMVFNKDTSMVAPTLKRVSNLRSIVTEFQEHK